MRQQTKGIHLGFEFQGRRHLKPSLTSEKALLSSKLKKMEPLGLVITEINSGQ